MSEVREVVAKIVGYKQWRNEEQQLIVTFDSLEPFLSAGLSKAHIKNKSYLNGAENTLFINSSRESMRHGWALFKVRLQTYPLILFVRMTDAPPMNEVEAHVEKVEDQVETLEERVASLEDEVKRLRRVVNKLRKLSDHNLDSDTSDDD